MGFIKSVDGSIGPLTSIVCRLSNVAISTAGEIEILDFSTILTSTLRKKLVAVFVCCGSTDFDIEIGSDAALAVTGRFYKAEGLNDAYADDTVRMPVVLSENILFAKVTNNDASNATGDITLTLYFE